MTPEREETIREAWERDGRRAWRWSAIYEGYQHLEVPIMPESVGSYSLKDRVDVAGTVQTITFTGSYATFPGGVGPDRPRYRFITCEGLVVHQERIQ